LVVSSDWKDTVVDDNFDATEITKTTSVNATVYDDYSMIVNLPDTENKNDWVSASNVTVAAQMQHVSSLNVDTLRQHSLKVNTGIDVSVRLGQWLPNCYTFDSSSVTVNIKETGGEEKSCVYTFTGDKAGTSGYNSTITATTNVEEARAAWAALTSHVKTTGKQGSNSYITIANGSWLQVGDKVLMFEDGNNENLVLDNFNKQEGDDNGATTGLSALNEKIRAAVKLADADKSGVTGVETSSNTSTVKAVLKKGTTLAVSSSWAVLENDVTITVTGLNLDTKGGNTNWAVALNNALTELQQANNMTTLLYKLVCSFDALVGAVDGGNDVTVNIEFAS
jgi:hypothetical protein